MNSSTIKKRLDRLLELVPPESTCIVRTESGEEQEVTIEEAIRNIGTVQLVRMVNCSLSDLDEYLSAGWKEAWNGQERPTSACEA